jgi:hypothetical protein
VRDSLMEQYLRKSYARKPLREKIAYLWDSFLGWFAYRGLAMYVRWRFSRFVKQDCNRDASITVQLPYDRFGRLIQITCAPPPPDIKP